MKTLSLLLCVSLMIQTIGTCFADVTSTAPGQKYFIKVTRTTGGAVSNSSRIKFEMCDLANVNECNPIGNRDYSFGELRELRRNLTQQSQEEGNSGAMEIIGSILGVLGGIMVGFTSGALISAAIVPASEGLSGLGVVALGAVGGAIVIGTFGGILIYKWIRHHKEAKAAELKKKADMLDDAFLEGQDIDVSDDISDFAHALGDLLSSLPPNSPDVAPAELLTNQPALP